MIFLVFELKITRNSYIVTVVYIIILVLLFKYHSVSEKSKKNQMYKLFIFFKNTTCVNLGGNFFQEVSCKEHLGRGQII